MSALPGYFGDIDAVGRRAFTLSMINSLLVVVGDSSATACDTCSLRSVSGLNVITRSGSPMLAADQIGDGGLIVGAVEVGLCLQKCFWGGDRKSLKPLMRFTLSLIHI